MGAHVSVYVCFSPCVNISVFVCTCVSRLDSMKVYVSSKSVC